MFQSREVRLYASENIVVRSSDPVIEKLIACESAGDPNAYNPKDNDGLPKYGILQYRLETFREQAILYKMLPKNANFEEEIKNPDTQIALAKLMIADGKIGRWGCSVKVLK